MRLFPSAPSQIQTNLRIICVTSKKHHHFTFVSLSPHFLNAASWRSNLHLAALTFLMPVRSPSHKNLLLLPLSKAVTVLTVINKDHLTAKPKHLKLLTTPYLLELSSPLVPGHCSLLILLLFSLLLFCPAIHWQVCSGWHPQGSFLLNSTSLRSHVFSWLQLTLWWWHSNLYL